MSTNENKSGRPKKGENPFTNIFREMVGSSTQQEVADKIGVSRQNIGRWLSGDTTPDIETLCKIADAYNISTDYLLGRTSNKTTNTELKAVCDFTGLTEDAVNTILKAKNIEMDWLRNTINFILGNGNLDLILNIMYFLNTASPHPDKLFVLSSSELLIDEKIPRNLNLPVPDKCIRQTVNMHEIIDRILFDDVCVSLRKAKKIYKEHQKGADENG